ncbi:type III pantothenate kinase [Pseudoalteromonas tunicata]|jgi:type III pantothenate kinase|uniref:Type III pantothenate kinase n=2 Tax=Pseudoalteromonas tunicata TaxID=314281 RepID=A4CFA0_9GAMM|nr:type III pantothenate kinase [Pseudoalteromonas tunicata]AXT31712.1 type III pantothenate kinase [Pseudoalteromonas tunicata]EAR26648.1 putative transcriptional regulatory protein [Pseudoalteromonas tunicata D2]MDP5214569.1 type III pantothenate kinase [Pseudoalteromonas tunicata]
MILLIDVGNTALKAVLYHQQQLSALSQAQLNQLDWSKVTALVYSAVRQSPALTDLLAKANTHQVSCVCASVTSTIAGIKCAYPIVKNLGIDRWLAVLAAVSLYPNENVVVVDSGTATTIDLLSKDKQHLGGWILPGLDLMVDAVTARTEKVFTDLSTPYASELGTNTPQALKNGCLMSTLGAVEFAKTKFNDKSRILFTGGNGQLLKKEYSSGDFNQQLLFIGLLFWYENQSI